MNYQQTIDFLFAQLPMFQREGKAAYKANLDNTLALDKHFGHPHTKFKTIHVAGTNGKGSVSHMLASILQEAGLKVGLYTSPHLLDFRERIKINGDTVSEQYVIDFVNDNKSFIEELKPSFFEMTVAMAFNYFADCEVDIAVIEVGLGGRLDSTNIIKPIFSIITNIGLDHVSFLGETLEDIALEKAGVIKSGIPIILGEERDETSQVFLDKAAEMGSPYCFAERRFKKRVFDNSECCQELSVRNEQSGTTFNISLDLKGEYQQKNILTVFSCLQVLTPLFNLPKDAIVSGLANVVENTKLRGRWEVIQQEPRVICDTGHNVEGVTLVVNQLKKQRFNKLHIVIGLVDDKDVESILELFPKDAYYYYTQANIPRALSCGKLAKIANEIGLEGSTFSSVAEAYGSALESAKADDVVFVGGSTFVVADLLGYVDVKL